jgi:hypothetical protein
MVPLKPCSANLNATTLRVMPNAHLVVLQDRDEATMELSLFAEAFQEMLARQFGERILKSLYEERYMRQLPFVLSKSYLHDCHRQCGLKSRAAKKRGGEI